jgi:RNA polymerase sigma-70 factor (ECF subfamily)
LYEQEDSEDVAQEVALRIYTSIAKLKEPDAFGMWLYRIIINTCRRHNSNSKGKRHYDIDEYSETLAEERPDAHPADAAESNELSRSILTAMDRLPEKQRLSLFLYYYEDMSYDDISSALDISIGNVGSYISRGKSILKKQITEKKINFTPDTIGDKELGGALIAAFEHDIASRVPSAGIDAFVRGSMEQISHFDAMSGQATDTTDTTQTADTTDTTQTADATQTADTSHATSSHAHDVVAGAIAGKSIPLIIAAVVTATTTGAVSVIVSQNDPADQPPPPVAAIVEPYIPSADITLYDAEGRVSRVNPISARLAVNEGEPISWFITDASGATIVSGEGVSIEADTLALPPGDYIVNWLVRNERGQSVNVWSEFEIIETKLSDAEIPEVEIVNMGAGDDASTE